MEENFELVNFVVREARALVLTGYGINCDFETQFALEKAGFNAQRVHVNDLISGKFQLDDFHIFVLPGGFAYADYLGAGKALANKIQFAKIQGKSSKEIIQRFLDEKKLVLAICNGFQVAVKLGLLPGFENEYFKQCVSLMPNASGRFENRWVKLKVNKNSNCIFTKDIEKIDVPVRHGEGRFVPKDDSILEKLKENNQIVFQYADENYNTTMQYPMNPNGAVESIAGICDFSGRVLGLMPHPECNMFFENHPQWTRIREKLKRHGKRVPLEGAGLRVFRNAFDYVRKELL